MSDEEILESLVNHDAEVACFGACLQMLSLGLDLDENTLSLSCMDFHDRQLGEAFDLLIKHYSGGGKVDHVVFANELKLQALENEFSAWRGLSDFEILFELTKAVNSSSTVHLSSYVEIVKQNSIRRMIYNSGIDMMKIAISSNGANSLTATLEIIEKAMDKQISEGLVYYSAEEIAALRESGGLPEVATVVEHTIALEGITILGGDTSGGKSFAALDAAIGITTGRDVWGQKVTKPGPVIYHGKDMSQRMLFDRILELCEGAEIDFPSNLHVAWGRGDDDLDLEDRSKLALLKRNIQRLGAVLVIIDDLTAYAPNMDLNDASEVSRVMNNIRSIANDTGCAFLILTLLNKGSAASIGSLLYRIGGSVHIPGKADTCFIITRSGQGDTSVRTLTPVKNRMIEEPTAYTFQISSPPTGGLVIAYERSEPRTDSSLPEMIAGAFLEIIKANPEHLFTRADLVKEYKAVGGKGADRSISKVWRIFEAMQGVRKNTAQRAYRYSYEIESNVQKLV